MSPRQSSGNPALRRARAPVFAALGDETRLRLVGRLCLGEPLSISDLSAGSRLTRQAITKHLRVLEGASLVRGSRRGRKMLFSLTPEPIEEARQYLEHVSGQWEHTLARLKAFVESDGQARAP
jgi:DNA-binding transcriptional ArsR family regulator